MSNNFQEFTQKYALSKTLRFELKPVGKTKEILEKEMPMYQIINADKNIKAKYIQTKPFFDQLHRDFIKEAFENVELSWLSDFFENWKIYKQDKKANEKIYKKSAENLRKEVVSFLNAKWKDWAEKYHSSGLKKADIEILFEEGIFKVLEIRYWTDTNSFITNATTGEITSIFQGWKWFTGYFLKFWNTRENYYKTDGTSTAIATRIVDQNLPRYLENLEIFEKMKGKIDFESVRWDFSDFEKIGTVEYYSTCLLQEGIDWYNRIIWGYTYENGEKIKGINEIINLYRQTHKDEKVPFLKTLDKQIWSEKIAFMETIDTPEEFRKIFEEFVLKSSEKVVLLKQCLNHLFENELTDWVFLSKESLNTISHKWIDIGNMKLFHESLFTILKKEGAKYDSKEDEYKFPDFIRISDIKTALVKITTESFFWKNRYLYEKDENPTGFLTSDNSLWEWFIQIFSHEFSSLFERTEKDEEWKDIQWGYDISLLNIQKLLENNEYNPNDEKNKIIIKSFADDILRIYQMGKYFALEKKRQWNPDNLEIGEFYSHPEIGYDKFYFDSYKIIVQGYNDIRNYLTKNPWSEEKWKLNFENPTLANGWDKNKETDNSCIFLKRDNKFFLALMSRGNNQVFDERNIQKFAQNIEQGKYEKMVYKYMKDVALWIPKATTQLNAVQEHFFQSDKDYIITKWWSSIWEFIKPLRVTKRIFELNNRIYPKDNLGISFLRNQVNEKEQKNYIKIFQKEFITLGWDEVVYKKAVHDWIDFCKEYTKSYPSCAYFDYSGLKDTKEYSSIDEFYNDLDSFGYQISWQDISSSYIDELVESGKLYLFEIYNQDFSNWKTGAKNLHTLYFEHIFSKENQEVNFPLKLNGQAELFFRPKSIEAKGENRKFNREIIAKKRYTEDKIFFHVPLTLNRTEWDIYGFNTEINNFLAHNPDINIIGIDRGEKHLAYYSVIDQKGNIIESDSLNTVNEINYGEKLTDTAEKRKQARQDWQAVEGIKNLKKGYISAVVHKLTDLIIKYNAIVIFEDLNMRFKQIRGGIEKSVYQQLEKALIEKLNYLVEKWEINPEKAGHLLNAYQLTAPFETFKDMGKQTGIVFYTQAAYTSKIDPVTGWRPHLYLKYSSAEQVKKEIAKFSNIIWNNTEKRFDFMYDIRNFSTQKEYPKNNIWTVCSSVERYRWDKTLNQNKWDYVHYKSITPEFEKLFSDFQIDGTKNILEQINRMETKWNEKFFKSFIFFFGLICQIRNTNKADSDENKQDFILSPVVPFFDSRDSENTKNWLPRNGDENGAYNIARKGLIILQKINEFSDENGNCDKLGWKELSISQVDWDNYIKT